MSRRTGSRTWSGWAEVLSDSLWFRGFIVAVIIVNAITIGVSTYDISDGLRATLRAVEDVFLGIFIVEMLIRLAAFRFNLVEFCKDPFRAFELGVVAAFALPMVQGNVTLLRLVRVLRVSRLVAFMPDARVLTDGMRRAAPPALSLACLIGLLCFLWAAVGWMLFGHRTPPGMRGYFDNLGEGMLTLFELLTLEGWNQTLHDLREITPWALVYVISFLLIGTYIVVNLVVGIIVNSLDDAYKQRDLERDPDDVRQMVAEMRGILDRLEARADALGAAEDAEKAPSRDTSAGRSRTDDH